MSLYLSRIEDLPPKQTAGGSNPPGDAKSCRNRKILALFYLLESIMCIVSFRLILSCSEYKMYNLPDNMQYCPLDSNSF